MGWRDLFNRGGQRESSTAGLADTVELLQERLAELEREDVGWQRVDGESGTEFSRDALRGIMGLSRLAYLKSPLVNRAVSLQASYVFGQGISLKAHDPAVDTIVQGWWQDRANRAELSSHQALILKEVDLQVDGNLFYVLFTNRSDGRVIIRSLPVDEVTDILMNPDDRRDPWYYKREWTETVWNLAKGSTTTTRKVAYYPDWQYQPQGGHPASIGGNPIMKDHPIYHRKVGGLQNMRFGLPETYAALDWAKAYKEFLEDRLTVSRGLSKFIAKLTVSGGSRGVAAAKARLGTTVGTGGSSRETNPAPVTPSIFIQGEGAGNLEPIKLGGATIHPDEGRRFMLMAAAALGWSEQFFGDSQVGALATAKALDRPAELRIRDRQLLWAEDLQELAGYVIAQAIAAPKSGFSGAQDLTVEVGFPPILEHDFAQTMGGVVDALTAAVASDPPLLDDGERRRALVTVLRGLMEMDDEAATPKTGTETEPETTEAREAEKPVKITQKDILATAKWARERLSAEDAALVCAGLDEEAEGA